MKINRSKTANLTILALVAACVALGKFALDQYREAQMWRQRAVDERMLLALRTRERDVYARQAFREPVSFAENKIAPHEQPAVTPLPSGGVPTAALKAEAVVSRWLRLANDPELNDVLYRQQRSQVSRRYAALFKQAGLSSEQQESFIKLICEKRRAADDLVSSGLELGDDLLDNPEMFSDMVQALRSDSENKIRQMLGDSVYDQYKEFDKNIGRQRVVAHVQEALDHTDVPLAAAQADALKGLMQEKGIGHINSAVLEQAKAFLVPQQINALNEIWQEQRVAAHAGALRQKLLMQSSMQRLAIPDSADGSLR